MGLLRSTHKLCTVCGTPASSYEQKYCWICFYRSWGDVSTYLKNLDSSENLIIVEPSSMYARFWYIYNETRDILFDFFQKKNN